MIRPQMAAAFAAGSLVALASLPARALDRFEIQVYQADVNRPGHFGLEVHTNYTLDGAKTPRYEGQIPPNHVARLTLEPAFGVTDWFEVGGYFQMLAAPDAGLRYGGVKLRGKFVVPERWDWPVFAGMNVEIGRVPHDIEEDGWANEFRPIFGWDNGYVLLDVNPIFGYALTGPDSFKPELEPAAKVAANTQLGFSLGLEYYAGLGILSRGFLPIGGQEHLLFGVFDLTPPAHAEKKEGGWEVNVAIGGSMTAAEGPHWIAKSIVGKEF